MIEQTALEVDEYHRHMSGGPLPGLLEHFRCPGQEDPSHPLFHEYLEIALLLERVIRGSTGEHHQAVLGGLLFHAPDQLVVERGEAGNGHANHLRLAGTKLARRPVADETQLVHCLTNPSLGGFGDDLRAIEHVGNGRDRHTGFLGYLTHPWGHAESLRPGIHRT